MPKSIIHKFFAFFDDIDADREFRREMRVFKTQLIRDVLRVGSSYLQGWISGYVQGPKESHVKKSAESFAIEAFMEDLTKEEKRKIFGDWTDTGECLTRGILTENQVKIIVGVMKESVAVSELDRLIVEGRDQLTVSQLSQFTSAIEDADKLAPIVCILRDRKAALDKMRPVVDENALLTRLMARLKAEVEQAERDQYVPAPARRIVLEEGRVAYEASSGELIRPGVNTSVTFGVSSPAPGYGEGWPGIPETRYMHFGVENQFKPEAIRIPEGFALTNVFIGSQNALPIVPGSGIPASALQEGMPQPDYPVASKGHCITLQVTNVSKKQLAFKGRIEGKEVAEKAS